MAEETKKAPAKKAAPKKAADKTVAAKKAPAKKKASGATVTVVQTKSHIGRAKDQHGTLIGLGLGKINRKKTLEDTPAVRGMIKKIMHLIRVEDAA